MTPIKLCRACRRPLKAPVSRVVWIVSLAMKYSDTVIGVFDSEAQAVEYAAAHHNEGDIGSTVVKMVVNQPDIKEFIQR